MDSSPPPSVRGTPQPAARVQPIAPREDTPASTPAPEAAPVAGPSWTPAPAVPRKQHRKTKASASKPTRGSTPTIQPKPDNLVAYTVAYVPGLHNIRNPAGDYVQKDINVEVARQVSLARAKRIKADSEEERARKVAGGEQVPEPVNPLTKTLIIHPGSRNLRFGRASDFYPKEVPNCIARPINTPNRGRDPPIPGSLRLRKLEKLKQEREAKRAAGEEANDGDEDEEDPIDTKIGYLRDYLKVRLSQNRLATDWRDSSRVVHANAKVKPESLPEHNDPYRIDWTEVEDRQWFIGKEVLQLPPSAGFSVRYPILNRKLNSRDWQSAQALLDDIALIIQESLRGELGIIPREYPEYAVVLIVPDHGDRFYVQEMTNLILNTLGFREIAVHQESYAAIFSAGISTACVVDIGAQVTSVTCVDDGNVLPETRINLAYGGDDITTALASILQRSAFPYKELDLSKPQEWLMMDNLKVKICTLEEHMVASTSWDFHVLKTEGLTQKYVFRTYDENILAPLCLFDTRMIDFEEKKGDGEFKIRSSTDEVDDMLVSSYGDVTGGMRACTTHLLPAPAAPALLSEALEASLGSANGTNGVHNGSVTPSKATNGKAAKNDNSESEAGTPAQTPAPAGPVAGLKADETKASPTPSRAASPVPEALPAAEVLEESSKIPLDAAIAASISCVGNENKTKAAASTILLIGGSSALKGLNNFLSDRLPPLLRAKNLPIQDVHIIPPPRNVNPRFVSWKGASVMCNLESLGDMWIRQDEWQAVGPRALKDRYPFF